MTIGRIASLPIARIWGRASSDGRVRRTASQSPRVHPLASAAVELPDAEAARLERRLAIEESARFDRYLRAGGRLGRR